MINSLKNLFYVCKVVLVDHNELDDEEKSMGLKDTVISIIDHHIDKNQFKNADPRIVDLSVGSNASLISELFYKSKFDLPDSFASMLLFPILTGIKVLYVKKFYLINLNLIGLKN